MKFKKAVILSLSAALLMFAFTGAPLRAADDAKATACPKKAPVTVETVQAGPFSQYLVLAGEGRTEIVAVKSPVAGILSEVKVSEGSLIDVDQELVVLNAGMDAEVKKLEDEAAKAKKILDARKGCKEKSERAIASAEKAYQAALDKLNAGKAQAGMVLKAPVAGVARLVLAAGSEIAVDTVLLEIANPRRMIFTVAAGENLAMGDKLAATSDAFSGEMTAEVVALAGGQAALAVNNENGQLRDGVRATFKKLLAELSGVIAVPAAAVQQDSLGEFIFMAEKGRARKMYVTVGVSSEGRTVVTKGLGAGTSLIVSGFDCLADGKKLRVVNAEELAKAEAARKEREAAQAEKKPVEAKPAAAAVKPSFFKDRFRPGLNFGLFTINDKNMKEFYGSSSKAIPGVELAIHTVRNIDLWLAYRSYTLSATTSYLEDTVDFKLAPLSIGLRYRFARKGMFEPFAGLGVNIYSYKETVGGDSALPDTSDSATGFHVQAGSYIHTKLSRLVLGEVFAKYNFVKQTLDFQLPDGTDQYDLGGFELGLGIVLKF
mgnify:CR=1 FL=1